MTARKWKEVGPAIEIVSAWLFGLMVFFANPLNDATDPASRVNYHLSENVRIGEAVRKSYGKDIHVEWREIMPYVYSGVVSFLGWTNDADGCLCRCRIKKGVQNDFRATFAFTDGEADC